MKQTNWKNTMNPYVKGKLSEFLEKYHFILEIALLIFPLENIFGGLVPMNSSLIFYANIILVFIYIIGLTVLDGRNLFKKHMEEWATFLACFLSVAINSRYSTNNSLLVFANYGMFVVGITFYPTQTNKEKAKKQIINILKWINYILIVVSLISIVFQILNSFFGIAIPNVDYFSDDGLFGGIYFNTNKAAFHCFVGIMLNIYFLKENKIVNIIGLLANGMIILFSGCRAVYIVLVICTIVFALSFDNKKLKKILFVFGLVVISLLIWITLRKMNYYPGAFLNQITGGRFYIWSDCLKIFSKNKWFGTGLNNITAAACTVFNGDNLLVECMGRYNNAHNGIINIIVQTGIIGSFAFLLLGKKYIYVINKCIKENRILSILVISIFILDLFDIVLIFTDKLTTYIFLLVIAKFMLEKSKTIIFVSNYVEQDQFEKLYVKYVKPGLQIQKFDRLIVEGIEHNDENIICYSAIPASSEVLDKKIIKLKNNAKFKYSLCINKPIIKDVYVLISSFFKFLLIYYDFCIIDPLSPSNSLGASLACKIRGIPCMGVITDLPEFMTDNKLYRKVALLAISNCSMYTFLSEKMNEKINNKNKPFVVVEGFSDSVNNKSCIHNDNIIYAGNLSVNNGIMNLIEAFKKSKLHENSNLVIFGDGNAEKEIVKIAKEDSRIKFMSVKSNKEVLEELYKAKLLVNPRPTNKEFVLYSFPSKTIEYLGTGTPFASTKLPSIPDEYFNYIDCLNEGTVEDLICYFNHFDESEYAERLKKAEKGKEFIFKCKNKQMQTKKMLDLVSLYEETLNGN